MNNHRSHLKWWLSQHWLHIGLVVLFAGLLRFVNLSTVPQGIFHDEAWSGAKALDLLNGTAPVQVYFPENNGMDALHVYLIAALFKLTGPLALGSRIISALMGTLTVLATYWLAWELPAHDRQRHAVAILAAAVYGGMLTAIATARSGWHSPSCALLATLCVAALARGRRLDQRRWFIIAGVFAGLAQYTYPSARLLPVWLIAIAFLDLMWQPGRRRIAFTHYTMAALAALIVVLPLGLFFLQNPQWLIERAQQTSASIQLGGNTVKTLLGLVMRGSAENLHNLPGRPLLDPVWGFFFIVGLIVIAAQRRKSQMILISGVVILSLAVILTESAPLTRRWTGVFPLVAIIVAIGLITAWNWITRHWPTRQGPIIATLVVGGGVIIGAMWSIIDYFGPYAANSQLFWEYDSGITQVADQMRRQPETRFFLTPYDRFYEVVRLTLAEEVREPIQSYNGMACALFPARTDHVTEWLVITEKDQHTLPLLKQIYPTGRSVWQLTSPIGIYAQAWQVPAGQAAQFQLERAVAANFADHAQLIGMEVPAVAKPGDTIRLRLAFKNQQTLKQLYKVFIHLRDAEDATIAQADRALCDMTLNEADWRPGDVLVEEYEVTIPAETAPGEYAVVSGLYQAETGTRLPVLAADLKHDGDSVTLGAIHVR